MKFKDNAVQELLRDKKYCFEELLRIREMWGDRKTFTASYIDSARRVMVGMLIYAPEEIHDTIYSHINELNMREQLDLFGRVGKELSI